MSAGLLADQRPGRAATDIAQPDYWKRKSIMRSILFVTGVALATAVALLSMRVITLDVASEDRSATPSVSIGIMQMMRDARGLEVQQYDAI
jgi:hypothetical protein